MQQITVSVPLERVAEFYEMFGRWLRGSPGEDVQATLSEVPFEHAPPEKIAAWWRKLTEPAKRVFLFLADQPGKLFDGTDVADRCGIKNGPSGVAGTLSWPGKHATQLRIGFPLEWNREEQKYLMTPVVAKLIRKAAK